MFGAQLQGTSNGYWASFLSIIGILFNGPTFALDIFKCKKYAELVLPIFLQILFSVLWTFFFFTSAVDSAVRGARGHNGYFGSISILSFLNMFFYATNVYFKFKSVEEEDIQKWRDENQTNSNSQQSIKDRILNFFNKSGNANGDLDSKTIDGMTHDEVMASLEQEKAKKDAGN